MFTLTRSEHNPIISPLREHPWEAAAAFNGCPIQIGRKTIMVYRAMSEPDLLKEPHARMSVIARADSTDGVRYENRKVLISPDREFDFCGCEDPRVTKMDGKYYIFYTALGGYPFSAETIKIAVAVSEDIETITEKHLVTPFNAKGMSLFPERINGKIAGLLTVNTDRKPSDICYVEFNTIEDLWSPAFWNKWYNNLESYKLNIRRLPDDHLEFGAPPVKTDKGWLVVYSHIQRYGRPDQVFGVETVLLEASNPKHVIGRTKGPFMVAEEYYENTGQVPHIVFPTGALTKKDKLHIYYGAADTHCAVASVPLHNLLASITNEDSTKVKRFAGNPIISPRPSMLWESKGTLNPGAIELGKKTHLLYRAVDAEGISTLGYASSTDGLSIDERSDKPVYFPRAPFESRGCEDPRLVEINKKVFMTYTAYDGSTPRVAVSSISTDDFLKRKWSSWSDPQVITPPSVANKDSVILPEPVKNGYLIFHRVHESVCGDHVASLDFSAERITQCIEIIKPRHGMWDGGKVGIATPPVKTKHGWLLLYHGVSWSTTYRVGAVLLDLEDPTIVKARTAIPLFEPQADYERKGVVQNVVFPCGLIIRGTTVFLYYGAADAVIGVATVKLSSLLKMLEI